MAVKAVTLVTEAMAARLPENEPLRLNAVREYLILDSAPEQAYDDIVQLAAFICKTPIALVSLVDSDREWFKARVGLATSQTSREHAFSAHAILKPLDVMIVPDASRDLRFAANPLVTGDTGIRFYAGAPLVTPTGIALGTLCVLDTTPRLLALEQIEVLSALSRMVVAQLELRRSIAALETAVVERGQYLEQIERLDQYQRKLEESQVQLEVQGAIDGLTGVKNRRVFQIRLEEEFERARRQNTPLSLAILDLDWFKQYNDSFGHPAGDEALRSVAHLLLQSVRPYDVVARYGGEEFAIIMPATGREGALVIAERCRRAIQRAVWSLRPVTMSLGVAILQADMSYSSDLVTKADKALYQSKKGGRNRVSIAADGD